jgi:hypothetical protein
MPLDAGLEFLDLLHQQTLREFHPRLRALTPFQP